MIDIYDDRIDTRDIIQQVQNQREYIDSLKLEISEVLENCDIGVLREDEKVELENKCLSLISEIIEESRDLYMWETFIDKYEDYIFDFIYGATLISDAAFVGYTKELAHETVPGLDDAQWPFNCIDWDKAAEELQKDYTEVEIGDQIFWVR